MNDRIIISSVASQFKDEHGRTLLLRGVNVGGGAKIPASPAHAAGGAAFFDHRRVSFVGRPFPLEEADEHFERLRAWGLTFIRWLVTWEAIEHAGPGVYDREYLDYVRAAVAKAGGHGLRLCVDPHQDAWSRFSGGDGAPGWTFEAVGMDVRRFAETGAAVVPGLSGDPLPPMIWPTNTTKLAAATMFTLFFGGADFAPRTLIDGEPAQEYLQRHYVAAVGEVARSLKGLPAVVGYGVMNEPQAGFIGWPDLAAAGGEIRLGASPSPFEAMLLGAGFPREVEVWERRLAGPRRLGRRLVNPKGARAWRDGFDCVWRQNGVWDVAPDGIPRLLRPDYFYRMNGRPVAFSEDYYRPFAVRCARALRAIDPDAIVFLDNEHPHPVPRWRAEDPAGIVYAPHWYDGPVLFLKRYSRFLGYDRRSNRLVFDPRAIRRSYAGQLSRFKREAAERLRGAPVLLGEFGIPFDLDGGRAYRTGDWHACLAAMDRGFRAVEDALMNAALWHYAPDNSNADGDRWNGEDLSIFSRDQRTDPRDVASGGRALQAVVRPYARATAGEPLSMAFDPRRRRFTFAFRHDPAVAAPTELFVPEYQYPRGCVVEVSDGTYEIDRERQTLTYRHSASRTEHTIVVRPGAKTLAQRGGFHKIK
jgi:hypothetical protein